jgi:hypothetical protein
MVRQAISSYCFVIFEEDIFTTGGHLSHTLVLAKYSIEEENISFGRSIRSVYFTCMMKRISCECVSLWKAPAEN